MGILSSLGATADQVPHLRLMGIDVGEACEAKHTPGSYRHPLLRIAGTFDASDRWEQRTAMEGVMLDGLYDMSAARRHAVDRHLDATTGPGSRLDDVTTALLDRLGISDAWMRLLAATVEDVEISSKGALGRPEVIIERAVDGNRPGVSVEIGDDVWWTGDHIAFGRHMTDIPQTVMIAAQERPLREVISHPVLDRHDIVTGVLEHGRYLAVRRVPTPLPMAA